MNPPPRPSKRRQHRLARKAQAPKQDHNWGGQPRVEEAQSHHPSCGRAPLGAAHSWMRRLELPCRTQRRLMRAKQMIGRRPFSPIRHEFRRPGGGRENRRLRTHRSIYSITLQFIGTSRKFFLRPTRSLRRRRPPCEVTAYHLPPNFRVRNGVAETASPFPRTLPHGPANRRAPVPGEVTPRSLLQGRRRRR